MFLKICRRYENAFCTYLLHECDVMEEWGVNCHMVIQNEQYSNRNVEKLNDIKLLKSLFHLIEERSLQLKASQ